VISLKLVRRNLLKHKMRSALTIASLVVGIFLLCVLRSLVVAIESGVQGAKRDRLVVQSAVSLFVSLPLNYQAKMEEVPGVAKIVKWQWFGAYWQEPKNFFANFATDPDALFDVFPEIEIVEGSVEEWRKDRRGCIVGDKIAEEYHWKVGQTIPLISAIFPPPQGDTWEFTVSAIYRPKSTAIDRRTMFFQWEYFEKGVEPLYGESPGTGTYFLRLAPGADQNEVMRRIEAMYENGPQRVTCSTEAAFQMQFVTMMGNIPTLMMSIGTGVLIAIALACVNTMLMAFRDQAHDVGIMKALGFTDGGVAGYMLSQSLFLCLLGGLLGVALAKGSQPLLMMGPMGAMFPGYDVTNRTMVIAASLSAAIGLVAGFVPALAARRMRSVDALRSVE
jgi:putative ABC transport system permease protein